MDQHHQPPEEEHLLKWIVRGVNLVNSEPLSLVLNAAGWKSMFGLIQDSHTAHYDTITDGYI